MKVIAILTFILGLTCNVFSQAKEGQIKVKTIYSQNVEKGGKQILEAKYEYDIHNNLIKEYDYDKEGKLKKYMVYTYQGRNRISEIEYTPNGQIEKKTVYTYNSFGDKTSRIIYSGSGKELRKKIYTYEYR